MPLARTKTEKAPRRRSPRMPLPDPQPERGQPPSPKNRRLESILSIAAGAAACVCLAVTFRFAIRRLFFGVSILDESFYLALARNLTLGATPFVDEWNVTQSIAVIDSLIVRIYLAFASRPDYLAAAFRVCYMLMATAVAALAFVRTSEKLGAVWAAMVSSILVLYLPFGFPTMSYNLIGSFGVLGAALWLLGNRRPFVSAGLAGCSHAVAMVTYPPLALTVIAFVPTHLRRWSLRWRHPGFVYLAALCCTGLVLVVSSGITPAAVAAYLPQLREAGDKHFGLALTNRTLSLINSFLEYRTERAAKVLVLSFAAAFLLRRLSGWLSALAVAAGIYWIFFYTRADDFFGTVRIMSAFGLVAPAAALMVRREEREEVKRWLITLWLPLALSAAIMSWFSDNGPLIAAIPLGLAGVATCYFIALSLALPPTGADRLAPGSPARGIPLLVLAVLLSFYCRSTNTDREMDYLSVEMEAAPYRGLYTNPVKKQTTEEALAFIGEVSKSMPPDQRLLIYPMLPAGYVATGRRSAAPSMWRNCTGATEDRCLAYLDRQLAQGFTAVRILIGIPDVPWPARGEVIHPWIEAHCRVTRATPHFEALYCGRN